MSPLMILTYVQADLVYVTWRWEGETTSGSARLAPTLAGAVPAVMAQALPDPYPGESISQAIDRAKENAFGDPDLTQALGAQLGDGLIPGDVVLALLSRAQRSGQKPRLRIQASPSLAQVPWSILRVRLSANGQRRSLLAELAVIEGGVPAQAIPEEQSEGGKNVVAVIDPRVPGQLARSELGSVLGRPRDDDALAALLRPDLRPEVGAYSDLARRRDLDRRWLKDSLRDARRWLYVGHFSSAGVEEATGANSAIHLTCVDDAGQHAPLRAEEIAGDEGWRMAPRVALIGCGSGSDLQYPEPMGWVVASAMRGAQLITATLWTIPTDATFTAAPLRSLILAVDDAHESADPAAALTDWQLDRARAWLDHGSEADSPLVWASLTTYVVR